MPSALLRLQLLAWPAFCAAATPPGGDAAALVQRGLVAHRAEARQGGGLLREVLEEAFGALPRGRSAAGVPPARKGHSRPPPAASDHPAMKVSKGGIHVNRTISAVGHGTKSSFRMYPGCQNLDQYGSNACMLSWDSGVQLHWSLDVPSGLKVNDLVNITTSSYLYSDKDGMAKSFLEPLFPDRSQAMKGVMICSLCSGNCVSETTGANFTWHQTTPTLMDDDDVCAKLRQGDIITHFDLANTSFTMPSAPPPFLQDVRASLGFHVSLAREGVGELLSQGMDVELVPPEGNGSATGSAAALAAGAELAAKGGEPEPARGLTESLLRLSGRSLGLALAELRAAGVPEEAAEEARLESAAATGLIDRIAVSFADAEFAGSSDRHANLSMTGEKCTSKEGRDSCTFPFGSASKASFKWNSDVVLEPGSYMIVKMGPQVSGFGSKWINKKLMTEFQMPACTDDHKPVIIHPFKQSMPMHVGKCGHYANQVSLTDFNVILPDIAKMNLRDYMPEEMKKYVPSRLDQMPPMKMHCECRMYHKDKSHIRSLKFEMAFLR